MTKYPPLRLNNTFHFGKYIGEGVGAVIDKDPNYVKWMLERNITEFHEEVAIKLKELDND